MHKKLEAELVSLAHSILQMKNKDEVVALRDKAKEVYEKLAVLVFVDEYIATTPNLTTTKEELLKKIDRSLKNTKSTDSATKKEDKKPIQEEFKKEEKPTLKKDSSKEGTMFEPKFDSVKIDLQSLKPNQISSKEEFRDSISADKTATLFEDSDSNSSSKKTLNDKLVKNTITIGLNDRIAFVNHLFNYKQVDFNRMLSELSTFKTEKEAKDFIANKVKPDYDWQGKEAYEERLISIIERKFS